MPVDGPAGRPLRPGPRRPADLGHRPLQPPLHLLHAGGGHDLPPRARPCCPSTRSSGWPGWPDRLGVDVDPAHRRRAAGAAGPRPAWSAVWPALGFDDLALTTNGMLLAAARRALAAAGLTPGQRQLRLAAPRAVRRHPAAWRPGHRAGGHGRRRGGRAHAGQGERGPPAGARTTTRSSTSPPSPARPVASSGSSSSCRSTPRAGGIATGWCRVDEVVERIDAAGRSRRSATGRDRHRPSGSGSSTGTARSASISSVTQPFCGTCNRLRLTADGCHPQLPVLRRRARAVGACCARGAGRRAVALLLRRAVWGKRAGPRHQRARLPPPGPVHVDDRGLAGGQCSGCSDRPARRRASARADVPGASVARSSDAAEARFGPCSPTSWRCRGSGSTVRRPTGERR